MYQDRKIVFDSDFRLWFSSFILWKLQWLFDFHSSCVGNWTYIFPVFLTVLVSKSIGDRINEGRKKSKNYLYKAELLYVIKKNRLYGEYSETSSFHSKNWMSIEISQKCGTFQSKSNFHLIQAFTIFTSTWWESLSSAGEPLTSWSRPVPRITWTGSI